MRILFKNKTILGLMISASVFLVGCASIKPVGDIGPKKLKVYNITNNDFLSSSHMLVVLDAKGNVAAYTGGTVPGLGTVGLQTGASLASAGAIYLGAKAIQNGLQGASVKVKGPDNVNVNVNANVNANASVTGHMD
jgi:hypothetical protein